jgi:hypothetical protein
MRVERLENGNRLRRADLGLVVSTLTQRSTGRRMCAVGDLDDPQPVVGEQLEPAASLALLVVGGLGASGSATSRPATWTAAAAAQGRGRWRSGRCR